jgi:hypothetical protein
MHRPSPLLARWRPRFPADSVEGARDRQADQRRRRRSARPARRRSAVAGKADIDHRQLDGSFCEGLRMPAPRRWRGAHGGPAYANLQGRKPREGARGWRGVGYGDLSAADELGERSRGAPASRWTVKRLLDERRVASNSVSCRTICDDRQMSGRALPWPVERQRVRRSDLRECDAVMRCRA